MMRALAPLSLLALATLSACGPVPVAQAQQECLEDARLAVRPRGEVAVGVGIGPGGTRPTGSVGLTVSSDYIMGRDPSDVYNRCVLRRSGQMPVTALSDQPGWRGR